MTTTKQSWLKRSLALLLAMMMVMSLGIANVSAEDAEALPPAKIPTEPLNKEAYQEDYYYAVLEVPAYLYNADVEDTYSMGNDALSHTAYIMLSPDGELTAKVQFHEMAYNGGIGHLTKMYYYENKEDYDDWIHGKDNNRHDVSVESFYDGIYPSGCARWLMQWVMQKQAFVLVSILPKRENWRAKSWLHFMWSSSAIKPAKSSIQMIMKKFMKETCSTLKCC